MAVNVEDEKRGWRRRLWRYGPLVAWACFVLFASSASFSASNTSRIIRPLLLWLFPDISEASLAFVHFLVRKAAHLSEYALLALLAARAFRTSRRESLRRNWWPAAFALVVCVALTDEYHQSFLPSAHRHHLRQPPRHNRRRGGAHVRDPLAESEAAEGGRREPRGLNSSWAEAAVKVSAHAARPCYS